MDQKCETCGTPYNDHTHLTVCPHDPLADAETLSRKDAAHLLLGKVVRFRHQTRQGPDHRITSVNWHGMVTLLDLPGDFDPSLFVPTA